LAPGIELLYEKALFIHWLSRNQVQPIDIFIKEFNTLALGIVRINVKFNQVNYLNQKTYLRTITQNTSRTNPFNPMIRCTQLIKQTTAFPQKKRS